MKKHSFKLLLIVLIIILSLSTVLLAACNNDGDDGNPNNPTPPPSNSVASAKMFNQIIDKMSSSFSLGESFGVDLSAAFVMDDKTTANKDVTFGLTAKGDANGKQTAGENETNFVIEFTKEQGGQKEVLLGLAYEAIANAENVYEPYFFINLMNGGYRKINGYSMATLYKMTQNSATTSADLDFDLGSIVSLIVPILFGKTGTVVDNVYTFNFNLATVFGEIMKAKDVILGFLKIAEEDLNVLIEQYLGGLTWEEDGTTKNVEDLNSLEQFLTKGMAFAGSIEFKFDANDKFDSAKASFDYAYNKEDKANYTLKVDKAQIGTVTTPVDSFAGFALNAEQRKTAQAVNLLKFSLAGTATGLDANDEIKHRYTIDVQSDIDAFALLDLLTKGTDKANLVATLKKLGYFHLQIDEVDDKGVATKNIITLHSKFDEGFAVLNFKPYKAANLYEIGLGGVYDFDALIDVIGMLGENGDDEPSEPENPDILGTIKNLVSTVQEFLAYFNFENMSENGVSIKLMDLVYKVCEMLNVDTSGLIGTAIPNVVGCDLMNIKFTAPEFGKCTTVATDTIECGIKADKDFKDEKGDKNFIKEIESLGLSMTLPQNLNNILETAEDVIYNKAFAITGKNLKGETVNSHGFIMGIKGLDTSVAGEQDVTFYIAVANDLIVLTMPPINLALDDLLPLSGVLKFETKVNVLAFDDQRQITVSNLVANKEDGGEAITTRINATTSANYNTLFNHIKGSNTGTPTIAIDGIGTYTIDESMFRVYDKQTNGKDVTDEVLVNNKFVKGGTYYAQINVYGYVRTWEIKAEGVVFATTGTQKHTLSLGEEFTPCDYTATPTYVNGTQGDPVNATVKYLYNNATYSASKVIDKDTLLSTYFDQEDNKYYLKKDLSYSGKYFTAFVEATVNDVTYREAITINIDNIFNYSDKISVGNSLNDTMSIMLEGVEYKIRYDGTKWIAISANGQTKNLTDVSFKWSRTGNPDVTFSSNGVPTNVKNQNTGGNRYDTIKVAFDIDGYYFKNTLLMIRVNEIQAVKSINTIVVDSYLNGDIVNVDALVYIDPTDSTQKTLEFKYGASGYAIYIANTDTVVYEVTVTVTQNGSAYELTDGKLTETGTYKVKYEFEINDGITQLFEHTVKVNAA